MALTPDDIVNYEFKQAMRGYAIPQVDDLLDRLADQVERNEREIDDLRQRLRETEARLGSTLETESTLKRTLVTAQEAAERALEDARQQADELRGAAEREVTEQLENARREAEELPINARAEADRLLTRARAEADEVTSRANAQAEEVTGNARAEADELMARARAEAEELSARARAEAEEMAARARSEADEVTARAQAESEEVTLRAQEAARAEVFSAREERSALDQRLDELREMEHRHRAILRRHLESHLAVLDDFDELPAHREPDDDIDAVAPAAEPALQIRVREEDEERYVAGVPFGDAEVAAFEAGPEPDADAGADHGEHGEPAEHATAPGGDWTGEDRAWTGEDRGSEVDGSHDGLFDHDEIDIAEEVAVASPWERVEEGASDDQGTDHAAPVGSEPSAPWEPSAEAADTDQEHGGRQEPEPSHEAASPWQVAPDVPAPEPAPDGESPSPWEPAPSFPPPAAEEREDLEGDVPTDDEQDAPQPHVRPRGDQPAGSDRERDPYEHYDRFRDLGHHNP